MEMENDALTGAEYDELFDWSAETAEDAADTADTADGQTPRADEETDGEVTHEEDTAPAGEESAGEGGGAQENPPGAPAESGAQAPRYTVKYYGKEYEMGVAELITNAQKGMDYDNVRAKMEAMAPAARLVEQYAAANGMSVQQYLQFAQSGLQKQAVQRLTAAGVPEEEARRMTQEQQELAMLRKEKAQWEAQQSAAAEAQKRQQPFLELLRAYPSIKSADDMPGEVLARVARGEHPLAAYRAWENAQLKAQLAARQAEEKNRRMAPGPAAGLGNGEKEDAFAQGFDSAFKF